MQIYKNPIHKSVVIRTRIRTFSPDVVFLLVSAFEEFKILLEDRPVRISRSELKQFISEESFCHSAYIITLSCDNVSFHFSATEIEW